MLHLNAQTLGATGEANTLGASVGDFKNPRLAIAKTQPGTTLCVPPPAVGLTLRPGNRSSGKGNRILRHRRRQLPIVNYPPTGRPPTAS